MLRPQENIVINTGLEVPCVHFYVISCIGLGSHFYASVGLGPTVLVLVGVVLHSWMCVRCKDREVEDECGHRPISSFLPLMTALCMHAMQPAACAMQRARGSGYDVRRQIENESPRKPPPLRRYLFSHWVVFSVLLASRSLISFVSLLIVMRAFLIKTASSLPIYLPKVRYQPIKLP